jgi:cysteine-rich repeat protein
MMSRTKVMFAGALLMVSVLAGCSARSPGATTSQGGNLATVVVSAAVVGTPIATMLITVSAADIPVPLAFNLQIQEGYATGTLRIPPGTLRTFTATAFDSVGNVTHEGVITVDVQPGQNPPLVIVMTPRAGQVPITIFLGQVSIQISPPQIALAIGDRTTFAATVWNTQGEVLGAAVQWASYNPGIAPIDPSTGDLVCNAPGSTRVAAVVSGVAGEAMVTCLGGACENDPNIGTPCGSSLGQCVPGTLQCAGDRLVCTDAIGPSSEVCNGLDDDCNGIVDDGCGEFVCGNAFVEPGEACDDGNTEPGDGCSADCQVEAGWTCFEDGPSICQPLVCGDGLVRGPESCDDGNLDAGDGCDPGCQVEPGFSCRGEPSVCKTAACGDGVLDMEESCDDGNTSGGDGCSSVCQQEQGWTCAGEPSACTPAAYRHTVEVDGFVGDYFFAAERFASTTPDVWTYVTWDDSRVYLGIQQPPSLLMGPNAWWQVYVDVQPGGDSSFTPGLEADVVLEVDVTLNEIHLWAWLGASWQEVPPFAFGDIQWVVDPGTGIVEVSVNRGQVGSTFGLTTAAIRVQDSGEWVYGGLYPDAFVDGNPAGIGSWLQVDFNSTLPPASPANKRSLSLTCTGAGSPGCSMYYRDMDRDGFGSNDALCLCGPQGDYISTTAGDCNDTDTSIFPGAMEICDNRDNNCDGQVDEDPQICGGGLTCVQGECMAPP